MRRPLARQDGFTLIEALVAMSISFIVFAATLTVIEAMTRQQKLSDKHNDAQQVARTSLDRLAKELRNLASPTDLTTISSTLPRSVDRNLPFDFIFRSVRSTPYGVATDANVQRVRYCLNNQSELLRMEQPDASSVMPPTPSCNPGGGWSNHRVVAQGVNNALGNRALFTYSGDTGLITATDANSRADISRVHVDLFVDPEPAARPAETKLSTGVQLRNQNREPRAQFIATMINPGPTNREVQLNGSGSDDPESQRLLYHWYDGATKVGEEIVFNYHPTTGGAHTITLHVYDPAGLEGVSQSRVVVFN